MLPGPPVLAIQQFPFQIPHDLHNVESSLTSTKKKRLKAFSAPSPPEPQTHGVMAAFAKSSSIGKRRDHVNSSDIY
jgi:hypothetical protein